MALLGGMKGSRHGKGMPHHKSTKNFTVPGPITPAPMTGKMRSLASRSKGRLVK